MPIIWNANISNYFELSNLLGVNMSMAVGRQGDGTRRREKGI